MYKKSGSTETLKIHSMHTFS